MEMISKKQTYANLAIHRYFEKSAENKSAATALIHGRQRWTYDELNNASNRLARYLQEQGVKRETPVGVCLPRSCDMIVAMLAVLKAGGSYVPLDPEYPESRIAFILEDSQVPLLLTRMAVLEKLKHGLRGVKATSIFLEASREMGSWPEIMVHSPTNPNLKVLPQQLAYTIYTSGSTGAPKGVSIAHQNAASLILWSQNYFQPTHVKGVLASTSICFDLSIFEIFATLGRGATIVLAENLLELPQLPSKNEVTLINTVPSAMSELLAMEGLPRSVRVVNLAGEPFQQSLIARIYQIHGIEAVYNLYGPSEDTTYSTGALLEASPQAIPHIGKPIEGAYAYMVGEDLKPLGLGESGELLLGGTGLSRGYHNRPGLAASRFIPNPFAVKGQEGDRLYCTGDLVERRDDGNFAFLGRLDHQVKIRGFRIELGEIESALGVLPGVDRAYVMAVEDETGEKNLTAYIQKGRRQAPEIERIRETLAEKLPGYMIPAQYRFLDKFPTTPNGKIDRKALLQITFDHERLLKAPYVAPRTDLERELVKIWSDILGVPKIGVHDPFPILGGHSLHATRILSRLRHKGHLPIALIFNNPTISQLARVLEEAPLAQTDAPDLVPLSRIGGLPEPGLLSFSQQRAWFFERFAAGSGGYNVISTWRVRGALNREPLFKAIQVLVQRHETLRTVFLEKDGEPLQKPQPAPEQVEIAFVDLSQHEEPEVQAEAIRHADAQKGFDLARGPLVRWVLIKLAHGDHIFQIVMHHIITDGWSMEILRDELACFYEAFLQQTIPHANPNPIQFIDVAAWQHQWLESPHAMQQQQFWLKQLSGDLPLSRTERPRPASLSFRCWTCPVEISPDQLRTLHGFCAREGLSLFMLLLGAFKIVRGAMLRETRLLTGTAIANRNREETERVIGFFVNTLVLQGFLENGQLSFRDFLKQIKQAVLDGYGNQDYPFDKLVDELNPERNLTSYNPIFQVMFILHNQDHEPKPLPNLTLEPLDTEQALSAFDLNLTFSEHNSPDGKMLKGKLTYQAELFQTATIQGMMTTYLQLLDHIVAHCDQPLQSFSIEPCVDAQRQSSEMEITGSVPIGSSVSNYRTYFLNRFLEFSPVGVSGELCIGGPSLAMGYLGRPGETAMRFTPDPFADEPGLRLYHTGDMGFFDESGEMIFQGRVDDQVKIRGFRIEPGEIEAAIISHPDVLETAVLLDRSDSDVKLIGCVRSDGVESTSLTTWVKKQLPDYMVPTAWIVVSQFPLTPNRKIDKKALLKISPLQDAEGSSRAVVLQPRTPIERKLAEIWAHLLEIPPVDSSFAVGATDHFFELGGHSLLATRLISAILQAYGVELSVREVFENPTLAALADILERKTRAEMHGEKPVSARAVGAPAPLSVTQRYFWEQKDAQPNRVFGIQCNGKLNRAALSKAVADLVKRRPILRTVFKQGMHGPVQMLGASPVLEFIEHAPGSAGDLIAAEEDRVFNLGSDPHCAFQLACYSDASNLLLITFHPVVCDEVSVNYLFRELELLYSIHLYNMNQAPLEQGLDYGDYAAWQQASLPKISSRYESWANEQAPMTPASPSLPYDQPESLDSPKKRGRLDQKLSEANMQAVASIALDWGVSHETVFLSVFLLKLKQVSGNDHWPFLLTIDGRHRKEIEHVVGRLDNYLVGRVSLNSEMDFPTVLAQVRQACRDVEGHDAYPFEKLVESRKNMPFIGFGLEAALNAPSFEGLKTRLLSRAHFMPACDLYFTCSRKGDNIALTYDANRFHQSTIEGILQDCAAFPGKLRRMQGPVILTKQASEDLAPTAQLEKVDRSGALPISPGQAHVWDVIKEKGGSPLFQVVKAFKISGMLQKEPYLRCLEAALNRHESLRTIYVDRDGRPFPKILNSTGVKPLILDLQDLTDPEREARRQAKQYILHPLDPVAGPVVRVLLFQLLRDSHLLIVNAHSMASDAASLDLLVRNLHASYEAEIFGASQGMDGEQVQYIDVISQELKHAEGPTPEESIAYWADQLERCRPVTFPVDYPDKRGSGLQCAHYKFELEASLVFQLQRLAESNDSTLSLVLLAAFKVLIFRYTGENEPVAGLPLDNRNRPGVEGVIGPIANRLVLRSNLSNNPNFRDFIEQVGKVAGEGLRHGETPFELVEKALCDRGWTKPESLFRMIFSFSNDLDWSEQYGDLSVEPTDLEFHVSPSELALDAREKDGVIYCELAYNTALLSRPTVTRIAHHFSALLRALAKNPDMGVKQVSFLDAVELNRVLKVWNARDGRGPGLDSLAALFHKQVARTPEGLAFQARDGVNLSYLEINGYANDLAARLQKMGVGPEVGVGLCLNPSRELAVGLLAIIKLGGVAMPVHPDDSNVGAWNQFGEALVILTGSQGTDHLSACGKPVLTIDLTQLDLSYENVEVEVHPDQLFHIEASGEALSYGAFTHLVSWQCRGRFFKKGAATLFGLSPDGFSSIWEMMTTLLSGGVLVSGDAAHRNNPASLLEYLEEKAVVRLFCDSKVLVQLVGAWEQSDVSPKALREVIVTHGSVDLSPSLAAFFQKLSPARLHFQSGFPEAPFVAAVSLDLKPGRWPERCPLGVPIGRTSVFLLDDRMQPTPIGGVGKLYVGGDGLGRGYLNRPAHTALNFRPNPFASSEGERLFRSSVVARHQGDGTLELVE